MAKSEGEGNEKKRKIKAKEEYRNEGVRAPREGRRVCVCVCACVRVYGCDRGRTARERGVEGKRLWGCWWSAVVHCKSPSTAFNYDVIANTDDGYFLRYTLYITRTALPRTKGRKILRVYGVLTARPRDCFGMFRQTRYFCTRVCYSLPVSNDSCNVTKHVSIQNPLTIHDAEIILDNYIFNRSKAFISMKPVYMIDA